MPNPRPQSLFSYLNDKAAEWRKQMDQQKKLRALQPKDPQKERERHERNKRQGMI